MIRTARKYAGWACRLVRAGSRAATPRASDSSNQATVKTRHYGCCTILTGNECFAAPYAPLSIRPSPSSSHAHGNSFRGISEQSEHLCRTVPGCVPAAFADKRQRQRWRRLRWCGVDRVVTGRHFHPIGEGKRRVVASAPVVSSTNSRAQPAAIGDFSLFAAAVEIVVARAVDEGIPQPAAERSPRHNPYDRDLRKSLSFRCPFRHRRTPAGSSSSSPSAVSPLSPAFTLRSLSTSPSSAHASRPNAEATSAMPLMVSVRRIAHPEGERPRLTSRPVTRRTRQPPTGGTVRAGHRTSAGPNPLGPSPRPPRLVGTSGTAANICENVPIWLSLAVKIAAGHFFRSYPRCTVPGTGCASTASTNRRFSVRQHAKQGERRRQATDDDRVESFRAPPGD